MESITGEIIRNETDDVIHVRPLIWAIDRDQDLDDQDIIYSLLSGMYLSWER